MRLQVLVLCWTKMNFDWPPTLRATRRCGGNVSGGVPSQLWSKISSDTPKREATTSRPATRPRFTFQDFCIDCICHIKKVIDEPMYDFLFSFSCRPRNECCGDAAAPGGRETHWTDANYILAREDTIFRRWFNNTLPCIFDPTSNKRSRFWV